MVDEINFEEIAGVTTAARRRPASTIPISVARRLRKAMPPQEERLWPRLRHLRAIGYHFRRQVPVGDFVVDFACLKHSLVVEIDGSQHGSEEHLARDSHRDDTLTALGFRVVQFWNSAVREDLDSVVDTIVARLNETSGSSL